MIDEYASFYIAGQSASLPYLRRRLDQLGKDYVLIPSFAPEILDALPRRYECIIACGSYGEPPENLPFVSFQHVGDPQRVHNLGAFEAELATMGRLNDMPASKTDWFHGFTLKGSQEDWQRWRRARQVAREAKAMRLNVSLAERGVDTPAMEDA